jgi:hypothetical protein
MIAPDVALELVRDQLRGEVLPRMAEDDDYTRSIVVAAIGILGELSQRVVEADAWCEPSVRELRRAGATWSAHLEGALAVEVADLVGRSRSAPSLPAERRLLLEAAERIVTSFWAGDGTRVDEELRREVCALVAADNALEVAAGSRR